MRLLNKNIAVGATLLGMVLAPWVVGLAQTGAPADNGYGRRVSSDDSYTNRTRALDEQHSRAEQEADRLVSLPAEKIIVLLAREPGLFLQVKKMLVRKAYQEGRVLDPKDLTDETLFRLIRQDENIRVLITNEIEDRNYVRVKPSREEIEQEWRRRSLNSGTNIETASGELKGGSQEDQYWSGQRQLRQGQPQVGAPPSNPPEIPSVPNAPTDDARRKLLQAQAQGYGNSADGLPLDVIGGMQQVSPDELARLLSSRNQALPNTSADPTGGSELTNISLSETGSTNPVGGSSSSIPSEPIPNLSATNDLPATPEARMETVPHPSVVPFRSGARSDQPALAHRPNPYADVPSLYDLYAQYMRPSPTPRRFGADVFQNGTGNTDQLPMDLPVGPDYVLGPGDGLNIDVWGSFSQRLRRSVDQEGKLALPEVGSLQVSGRTLGDVQHLVQTALRSQFRQVEADVSLSRLRTVRVYVVGDVYRPGAYDVSSLSTALNALYQAGGPTSRGSLRTLKHFRGKQLVESVDIYDLLLHGVHSGTARLQSGDTLLVPPLGSEVTVQGMVRRPGIYELNGEQNLSEILELAGGVLPSGTLRHVDVERVQAHESRSMLRLDIPENNNEPDVAKALQEFQIQDGDQVKISPILPFADKTVYLDGHVFRPGKYAYRDGMKVTDLVQT